MKWKSLRREKKMAKKKLEDLYDNNGIVKDNPVNAVTNGSNVFANNQALYNAYLGALPKGDALLINNGKNTLNGMSLPTNNLNTLLDTKAFNRAYQMSNNTGIPLGETYLAQAGYNKALNPEQITPDYEAWTNPNIVPNAVGSASDTKDKRNEAYNQYVEMQRNKIDAKLKEAYEAKKKAENSNTTVVDEKKEDETSNGNGGGEDAVIDVEDKSYQDILNAYLGNLGNFSYNPNTDAMYQSYLATMQNLGQRAMKDTMGQASALTGGYGSSYAQNAGGNAYNQYLESAGQAMPAFYNMAYNQYRDSVNDKLNAMNALNSDTSAKSSTTGSQFSKILSDAKNAFTTNGSAGLNEFLDSLGGYKLTDDELMQIMDYVENYGGTNYTMNRKGKNTITAESPSGALVPYSVKELKELRDKGEITEEQYKALVKLKDGERANF